MLVFRTPLIHIHVFHIDIPCTGVFLHIHDIVHVLVIANSGFFNPVLFDVYDALVHLMVEVYILYDCPIAKLFRPKVACFLLVRG